MYIFWDTRRIKFCIIDTKHQTVNWMTFEQVELIADSNWDLYYAEEHPNQIFLL